jgi:cytochrome c551
MRNSLIILLFAVALWMCGTGQSGEKTDRATSIKTQQYQIQGEKLYAKYCAQCHQANGEGLASLYPPLNKSDYLMKDLARSACVIKNGAVEEMVVNGKTYNQMMPPNPQLTPLEIAEIMTYITTSWDNKGKLVDVKDVEKWLKMCE